MKHPKNKIMRLPYVLLVLLLAGCLSSQQNTPPRSPIPLIPAAGNGTNLVYVNMSIVMAGNLTSGNSLVFGEGKYSVTALDVINGCSNLSIVYTLNRTKLGEVPALCRGGMTWLGPEGRAFLISVCPTGPVCLDERFPQTNPNEIEVTVNG